MDHSHTAWWLTGISAVALAVCVVPMGQRIGAYNTQQHWTRMHFESIMSREIRVKGFPVGSIEDSKLPNGDAALLLTYDSKQTLIPVKKPPAQDLPNLAAYDEWMKVLAMYQVDRNSENQQVVVPDSAQLKIVVRRTPDGFDPQAWGQVRRIDWVFDFYNLKPDGTVEKSTKRWPRKYRSEDRLRAEAEGKGRADVSKPENQNAELLRSTAQALLKFEPLQERSVEFQAAMHVIPKLSVPDYKFTDTAFSISVLGWTLPGTMISALVLVSSFAFAVGRRR